MNANAKKWVAALRSGDHKQGTGQLCYHGCAYCCLGVALEVRYPGIFKADPEVGEEIQLPRDVVEWLGLKDGVGHFGGEPWASLAALNDEAKYNFQQIADFIEENWERLKSDKEPQCATT